MENGALTSVSTSGATDGPVQAAMLAALRPGKRSSTPKCPTIRCSKTLRR